MRALECIVLKCSSSRSLATGLLFTPYKTAGTIIDRALIILFRRVVQCTHFDQHTSLKIDAVMRPFRFRCHRGLFAWVLVAGSNFLASSSVMANFSRTSAAKAPTFLFLEPLVLRSLELYAHSGISSVMSKVATGEFGESVSSCGTIAAAAPLACWFIRVKTLAIGAACGGKARIADTEMLFITCSHIPPQSWRIQCFASWSITCYSRDKYCKRKQC